MVKRLMDLGLCLLALPFLLPLMAVISVLIRLDSPGPAMFIQERVGKGGRRFGMYKFRTLHRGVDDAAHRAYMQAFVNGKMKADREGSGIHKPIDRWQVTRVGGALRRTSLDELPQVFNVLKGEMSLVGPRPNVVWEVEAYEPWHHKRLAALPGITGLAQVKGRSCISFDDIVQYDVQYIETQSLMMDLKILWWTIGAVLSSRGTG
jgi:lipopolysaccharide/colanic/teichoic acid biosynthesis glycosyltransferase